MDHVTSRIVGSGKFLPPHRMDNVELFRREGIQRNFDVERARGSLRDAGDPDALSAVEVFDRWARQVTGIRERRIVTEEDGLTTEDLCVRASLAALERAEMEPEDLDFIVGATVTPMESVPNLACTVAAELGVPRTPGYTVNAACAGFVYALTAGYAHIRAGLGDRVLVVAGDALSHITDYEDPKTAVLFGDGAGAVVLERSEEGDGILGRPYTEADYAPEHLYLRGQGWATEEEPSPKLHMGGGPKVLRQAIHAMRRVGERALASADLEWEDVHYVVPHQANLRITRGLERQLDLPRGRVVHTIQTYGNLSASTVGVSLDEVLRGEHGPLPDPTLIVLTAVGGGYTSAGAVISWRPGVAAETERILGR
ncbi:MAG: 3-oxoacyl-ACP synthase III family protein [Gemmatimonadota bacterium]